MSTHDYLCNKLGLSKCSSSDGMEKRSKLRTGGRAKRSGGGYMDADYDDQTKAKAKKPVMSQTRMSSDTKDSTPAPTPTAKPTPKGPRIGYVRTRSTGGPMRREKHDIGDVVGSAKKLAEKAGSNMKDTAEDVGNKIKNGAEDAWGKVRNFFHFEEGGMVPTSEPKSRKYAMGAILPSKKDMENVISGGKRKIGMAGNPMQAKGRDPSRIGGKGGIFGSSAPLKKGGRACKFMGDTVVMKQIVDELKNGKYGSKASAPTPKWVKLSKDAMAPSPDPKMQTAKKGGRMCKAAGGVGKIRKDQYK